MTHSRPSSDEHASSFPVGSRVTYTCIEGAIKIPERSDTVECLPGARWSKLPEPCGRKYLLSLKRGFLACLSLGLKLLPLTAAALQWHHPSWQGRSCGDPGPLPGGRMVTLTDLQFGAMVKVFCEDGYKLDGSDFIQCLLKGNDVAWSKLPTCELITCSSPPQISNGKHDGEGVEKFAYNSTVTYSCDSGFQLVGNVSIRCTSMDKTSGVWSGAAPECKGDFI
ncbi:complement decay-accelerating factor-like [Grus japonensis]|uniref:Complement decay-accelerating factor-like n=1 Tax=Grus japonensis TaxID=30415 RepID=A0ABC9XRK7_GRUJA